MPDDSLDAILELTRSRKMRAPIGGESTDAQKSGSAASAVLEVSRVRFGSAKALSKAKAQDERAKLDEAKRDEKDAEEEETRKVHEARDRSAPRSGKIEQDYRFQVVKQVDKT